MCFWSPEQLHPKFQSNAGKGVCMREIVVAKYPNVHCCLTIVIIVVIPNQFDKQRLSVLEESSAHFDKIQHVPTKMAEQHFRLVPV